MMKFQEVYSTLITLSFNQLSIYIFSIELLRAIERFLLHHDHICLIIYPCNLIMKHQGLNSITISLSLSQLSLCISFIEFLKVIERLLHHLRINLFYLIIKLRGVCFILITLSLNHLSLCIFSIDFQEVIERFFLLHINIYLII